jgi:flagellin-like hook-associated protein FlgL
MSLTISSTSSLSRANTVDRTSLELSTTLRRLSSGLRIQLAKDDVAGSMITERLTARLRGAVQSVQNMNLGAALLQVIDGALGETQGRLMRMRELAVYAATETLSNEDRRALDQEFTQLKESIDEIAEATHFNQVSLLNRGQRQLSFQVGPDVEDEYSFTLDQTTTRELGRQARYGGHRRGVFMGSLSTGQITINGVQIRGTTSSDDTLSLSYADGSALAKVAAINAATAFTGVRAIAHATEVSAQEAIQEIDLTSDHWLEINGARIGGFQVFAKDGGGRLVEEINRAFFETRVTASVDSEGRLSLRAEDGRNISVHFSDSSVRQAFSLIDAFGDELNLGNTVFLGSPSEVHHGKVEPVVTSGPGNSQDFSGLVTASGQYTLPKDHIDYVIEVVEAGALGVAKYRFKEEVTSDIEPPAENFAFLDGSIAQPVNTVKVAQSTFVDLGGTVTSSGDYSEALERTYTLEVTRAGTTDGADRAEYQLTSSEEGLLANNIVIQGGSAEALDLGVQVTFSPSQRSRAITGVNLAADHSYDRTPTLQGSYTGDIAQNFEARVTTSGYTDGSAQVTIFDADTGVAVTGVPQAVNGNVDIFIADGVSIRFQNRLGTVSSVTAAGSNSGSYSGAVTTTGPYLGTDLSTYLVEITQAGVLGGNAMFRLLKDNVEVSGPQPLSAGVDIPLSDGAVMTFGASPTSIGATTSNIAGGASAYQGNASITGPYTGVDDTTVIARVKTAGRVDGSARIEYSLDNGANFQGDLAATSGGPIALASGLSLNLDSSGAPNLGVVSSTSATYLGTATLGGSYTGEANANVVVESLGLDGFGQELVRTSLDDGLNFSASQVMTFGVDLSLGSGLTINFSPGGNLTAGDAFTADVDAFALSVGDTFSADVEAGRVEVGDQFKAKVTPKLLASGSVYTVAMGAGRLEVGDIFTVDALHSFTPSTPLTLTSNVSLTNGVDVAFNSAGPYAVGDEFYIHTRGYTGDPTASGFYTDTLHPTTYVVEITQEGDVGTAQFKFDRADGLGSGTNLTSATTPVLLSEGVSIAFSPGFLSVGDQFIIDAGQKLEYTFSGSLSLQSEGNIEITYDQAETDNQLGRLLYVGDEANANEAGIVGNLTTGILGANTETSVYHVSLQSVTSSEEAIDTITLAIDQVSESRSKVGSTMTRLSHRIEVKRQEAVSTSVTRQRIRDLDLAVEMTHFVSQQTRLNAAPLLARIDQFNLRRVLDLLNPRSTL